MIGWNTRQFFKLFYKGFPEEILTWFPYANIPEFELPSSFRFEFGCSDPESSKIFNRIIKSGLLPIGVRHSREKPPVSYEFYNPSIANRQIGCGQLPPKLFFADKLKPRESVDTGIEFNRIM